MQIRFAQPEDVGGILALLRQVGQVHHQGRPDIFRTGAQKYGASQVLNLLNNSATPVFVAVEEDVVLGYGFCVIREYCNDPVIADHTELYIDDLCVDVLVREINSQTGALRRTGKLLANTRMNAGADGFAIDSAHILVNFVISV